jgi:hypothetical protein
MIRSTLRVCLYLALGLVAGLSAHLYLAQAPVSTGQAPAPVIIVSALPVCNGDTDGASTVYPCHEPWTATVYGLTAPQCALLPSTVHCPE